MTGAVEDVERRRGPGRRGGRLAVWAVLTLSAACVGGRPGSGTPAPAEDLPPAGFGTLRQDDVTITLRAGSVALKVTPLAESVIRVTAPDTYRRLAGLADAHAGEARRRAGVPEPQLFLVSFYTQGADLTFIPEEVQVMSRGLRYRPLAIVPVTPGWGQRRLRQRTTEMAVYAFSAGVDLKSDLEVEYGDARSAAWTAILPRVQAERARARARARIR